MTFEELLNSWWAIPISAVIFGVLAMIGAILQDIRGKK